MKTLNNDKEYDGLDWYIISAILFALILAIIIIILLTKKAEAVVPLLIQNCTAYGCQ